MVSSLLERGLEVFCTNDADSKALMTIQVYEDWNAGLITSVFPEVPFVCPQYPSRPVDIKMVAPWDVKVRGVVGMIHGIVHAESYAIDLSWDIMIRFGEENREILPREFFADWLKVAYEEATHYSRWRDRLIALGSYYGERGTHSTLWDAAQQSDTLLKRLALVHMTHEARGLDTANIAIEKLRNVKDEESIVVLRRNVAEEITHVGKGVRWFQHLCKINETDAVKEYHSIVQKYFDGKLKPPFDHDARLAAGMTRDYYEPLVNLLDPIPSKESTGVTLVPFAPFGPPTFAMPSLVERAHKCFAVAVANEKPTM